ncbi:MULTISPECIES: hypothetical protein [unclassified Microcoleus]|uniref:hypothetical protein n=1 Tax=unclassified Microcoleus TaxID=2642155 RepID=UPI002FD184BC
MKDNIRQLIAIAYDSSPAASEKSDRQVYQHHKAKLHLAVAVARHSELPTVLISWLTSAESPDQIDRVPVEPTRGRAARLPTCCGNYAE